MLVAWVQGAYSIGGDTVRCQFYSAAGVPQWAAPTLVAYRTLSTVIYVLENGLNIIPTSTEATITYDVALRGGADVLSFNQVSPTGVLRSANNVFQLPQPNSNVFVTIADGGEGFYAVSGSGGITSATYAQHYDLNGNPWAAPLALSANGPDGRGGQVCPATAELRLALPAGAAAKHPWLYDAQGRLTRAFADTGTAGLLSVRGLPAGLYVLRGTLAGHVISHRIAVEQAGKNKKLPPFLRGGCSREARTGGMQSLHDP